MPLNHEFVSAFSDGGDATKLRPSNWNDDHVFTGGTAGYVLTRDTGAADGMIWVAPSGLSGIVPSTRTVNGYALSGNIALAKADVGLSNVDNTTDAGKPVSTAGQTALDLKANLASPTFTGTVVVPAASFANAALANMATKTYKGRTSAGTGVPEDVAVATLKADLALNLVENTALSTYTVPSAMSSFLQSGTGAVIRTVENRLREVVSVKDFGAVGDGVADDTTAISDAQISLSSTYGGVLYFPPGRYLLSGSGLLLRKSNIIYRGAGMYASTLTCTSGTLAQASASFPVSDVTFEDLGFDGQGTTTVGMVLYRYVRGLVRVSRCRFYRFATTHVSLDSVAHLTVEDSVFASAGDGKGSGVTGTQGMKHVTLRRNRFSWLSNGFTVDTGTVGQSEQVTEFVTVEGNLFEGGWWLLTSRFAGSGGPVTYSGTVLTDTGASFTGLGANDTVRVMAVKQTGTAVLGDRLRITDASATFIANLVRRGDIVRIGSAFAVVANVELETVLRVEDWLSDTDRQPVALPADGTYTVYGVVIGSISSSTATTITVGRWHDFDGTSVTPSAGTRYEVLQTHPNYPLHLEYSTRSILIEKNIFRRGWSDQCSVFGYEARIVNNLIEDGQDVGITLHGQHNTVTGNTIRHQGGMGIFTQATDSVFANNVMSGAPWQNNVNTLYLANITLYSPASRNLVTNNIIEKGTTTLGRYGIAVYWSAGAAADANVITNNIVRSHTTADILVRGASVTNTQVFGNSGVVLVDTGAVLGTVPPLGVLSILDVAGVITQGGLLNLVVTKADGLVLQNTTAATAGVPVQWGPDLRIRGTMWNSTSTLSNTSDWMIRNIPVNGASPSSILRFIKSVHGAAETTPFQVTSAGAFTSLGSGTMSECFVVATGRVGSTTNGTLAFIAAGQMNLVTGSVGVGVDFATDTIFKVRTRAQTGYAAVDALSYRINGGAGAVGSVDKVQKSVAAIADATLTTVWTITVPNAAHSAKIRVTLVGSLGAGGAIGANEASATNTYDIVVTRTAGVNAVAAISTVYGAAASAVAGAATVTAVLTVGAVSGAVGASNTFPVQVTITKSGGASANHTCQAIAEVLNANATGVTIA